MSDDAFTHDDERFKSASNPGGMGVSDAETKYADLFADVVWDGVITPDKRQQLSSAARALGLSTERAQQIEQALGAAHRLQVIEERDSSGSREPSQDDVERSIDPLVDANDPRLLALQGRIHHLETDYATLEKENAKLQDLNEGFAELVRQLQEALESTLNDLDSVHRELARHSRHEVQTTQSVAAPAQPADEPVPMEPMETPRDPAGSSRFPSTPPPSLAPFKKSPSAPGAPEAPAAAEAWTQEWPENAPESAIEKAPESAIAPESTAAIPTERPTTRGFAAPGGEDAGHVDEAPPPPVSTAFKRPSSRRVLDASARAAPMVAFRQKRENPIEIHKLLCTRARDAELLHQLFRSLGRADDLDRRWCTAHALVYLGDANDQERELFLEHMAPGLVRPSRSINDDEWRELLFHPDEEPLTGEILSCIAPAVLLGQMTLRKNDVVSLDPSQRVEPSSTTLQAVRCMEWAAAFLGLQVPPIYACPGHDGLADIVLSPTPSSRLGRLALSGRSAKELAFVAGRHLAWYRQEHLLGKPTRSVRRLEDTFLAALMIGNPGLPMASDVKQRVEPLVQMIRPLIDGDGVAKLQHCFTRFVEHGGRTSLSRWYRGVERTSACTGLLLSNDLLAADAMLRMEAPDEADDAMGELVVFFTAGRCSMLRRRIGISVRAA